MKPEINEETANIIIEMIEEIGNIKTRDILRKVYPSLECIVSNYDQFIKDEVEYEIEEEGIIYTSNYELDKTRDLYTFQATETHTTEYIGDWVLVFRR